MFLRHGKLFGECVRPSSLSSQYASVSVQLTLSLSHAQTSTHTLSPLNKQAKGVYFSTDACRPHYKADAGLGANVLLPLRLLSSFPVLFSHAVSAGYIHSYYAVASIRSAAFKHIRRNSGLWIVFRTTTMLGKVHFEGRKAKCEFFSFKRPRRRNNLGLHFSSLLSQCLFVRLPRRTCLKKPANKFTSPSFRR